MKTLLGQIQDDPGPVILVILAIAIASIPIGAFIILLAILGSVQSCR